MEIKYFDEADLQRKICKKLEESNYYFEKADQFCDLVDKIHRIYIEVKPNGFAPAQIIYGLAREKIKDATYIGLANSTEIQLYKAPDFDKIDFFGRSIDPELKISPSLINKIKYNITALELLHDLVTIYTYDEKLILGNIKIFVNKNNMINIKQILEKYGINISKYIIFIADLYSKNQNIYINKEGFIYNESTLTFFENDNSMGLSEHGYKPIKNISDRRFIENLCILPKDIIEILHEFERMNTTLKRRSRGAYFTKNKTSEEISDIVKQLKPEFIIEPYVGAGSLIESIIPTYSGAANDINSEPMQLLTKKYEGSNWKFTNVDTITTPYNELMNIWAVPPNINLLILTNPPFGSVSVPKISSKEIELVNNKKSRNINIQYGTVGTEYGKGDLIIPAIGKLIQFIKIYGRGYLAFFCPIGIFCGRYRYLKILEALLKDFEFVEGSVFSGEHFNSISKKKPIAFTIWHYRPNCNTVLDSLFFNYNDKDIGLKELPLLKDGWNYDIRKVQDGEIATQPNEYFNVPTPKMFHTLVKKGGSELLSKNVKIDLKIKNVPSELIYGLWSTTVGLRAFIECPIYIDNAYVHLPDFSKTETMEILSYMVLNTLFNEINNNYCEGKIGFIGMGRIFKFGGERLTIGAKYLIDTYGYCPVGDKTIKTIFEQLQNEPDINKLPIKKYKSEMRIEVSHRLDIIGYWLYIPIPKIKNQKELVSFFS